LPLSSKSLPRFHTLRVILRLSVQIISTSNAFFYFLVPTSLWGHAIKVLPPINLFNTQTKFLSGLSYPLCRIFFTPFIEESSFSIFFPYISPPFKVLFFLFSSSFSLRVLLDVWLIRSNRFLTLIRPSSGVSCSSIFTKGLHSPCHFASVKSLVFPSCRSKGLGCHLPSPAPSGVISPLRWVKHLFFHPSPIFYVLRSRYYSFPHPPPLVPPILLVPLCYLFLSLKVFCTFFRPPSRCI